MFTILDLNQLTEEKENHEFTFTEKSCKCEKCNKLFNSERILKMHLLSHGNEQTSLDTRFKCGKCDKSFVNKRNLKRHSLGHKNEKMPNKCQLCGKTFIDSTSLKSHLCSNSAVEISLNPKTNFNGKLQQAQPDFVDKPSSLSETLTEHFPELREEKSDKEKSADEKSDKEICGKRKQEKSEKEKCGQENSGQGKSDEEESNKEKSDEGKNGKEKPDQKEYAKRRPGRKKEIDQKKSNEEKSGNRKSDKKKLYKCNMCRKSFPENSNLQRHKKLAHRKKHIVQNLSSTRPATPWPVVFRNHPKKGGITYRPRDSLVVQEALPHQSEETDNKCKICGKIFAKNTNLDAHLRVHSGKKPYECSLCSAGFGTYQRLKEHSWIHTGEKLFHCDLCNVRLARKSAFTRHCLTFHSFKCTICGKRSLDKSDMENHFRVHTVKKAFNCAECGDFFEESRKLMLHLQKHNKEWTYSD